MEYEYYEDVIDAYEAGIGVEEGDSLTDYIRKNNIKIKNIEPFRPTESKADGGIMGDSTGIGIEVLFKPKRQNLFMGGPALTGQPLAIYNSMKAYQSFTDQEIADAIKQAGYDLPTADSGTTTPPDSTPVNTNQGGEGGLENRSASMGGIGYSPEQNVLDFQAYQDEKNKEAAGSPLPQELLSLDQKKGNPAFMGTVSNPEDFPYSGPVQQFSQIGENLYDVNPLGTITGQRTYKTPRTIADQVYAAAAKGQLGTGVDDEEELSTFQKLKGSFNQGITSVMDSPIGTLAGFAINPAVAAAKGIISLLPKSTPVGMVDGKAIYGVGSFGGTQGSINKENQTALNKTGNFTNFQLGLSGDPGRVAGDPTKNVFAGMNAQSAFGDISKGAKSRIDTISNTISKMTPAQLAKSSLPARKAKFEKQLMEHNKERVASREDKSGATGTKKGGFTNPGKNSYGPHKGGGGGGGGGCFLKGTLITMLDGTKKPVEQVDLGDKVAVGGKVFAVGRFLNTELYDYKGIKVSGSHMVNEDGTWMRVRDTKHGKSLGNDENTVYVFGSENRRILINDILFTDYFEIEDQEQLLKEEDKFFDNWKTFANNEDIKNVNTLNAS